MKIRRLKKAPNRMTVTFELLGPADERMAQYMYIKMHEKRGTLAAEMQAFYQCALSSQTPAEAAEWSEGLVSAEDLTADWNRQE